MEKTLITADNLMKKYRPMTLDEVVGQPTACSIIKGFVARKVVPNTILITGSPGVGKTTLGRIIASMINDGEMHDVIEENLGANRSIDYIRSVIDSCKYKPMKSRFKVLLMDEFHALTGQAADAFLKISEEPPKHVVFILCTNEPDKVIKTLKQRARPITLTDNIAVEDIETLLTRICKGEKIILPEKVIKRIAVVSNGAPRESIQILANVIDIQASGTKITSEVLTQTLKSLDIASDKVAIKLVLSMFCLNLKAALSCINDTQNHRSLLNLTHMLAWGVISDLTSSGSINYPQRLFIDLLKSKRPEVSLENAIAVFHCLAKIKHGMVYGSDEKSILAAEIGHHIVMNRRFAKREE